MRWRLPPVVWLLLVIVGLLAQRSFQQPGRPPRSFDDSPGPFLVQRAVDGDTLLLADGRRVRLIGVDTPETVHPSRPVEPLGPEATAFTRSRTEGRYVMLEYDRQRRDRYDRVLAYVYVDDEMLNEALIAAGYSRAETRYPYSNAMKRRFRQAETRAREAGVGIWGLDGRPTD
jgi:micrococcal nuclease